MTNENEKQDRGTTTEMLMQIFNANNIKEFIIKTWENITSPKLNKYLTKLCDDKCIKPKEVIKKADMNRQYGREIFKGKKANPSRDHVISLAFGFGLDYEESQDLLKVARHPQLYSLDKRDAVIIFCIKNKKSFQQTEEILFDLELDTLRSENKRV